MRKFSLGDVRIGNGHAVVMVIDDDIYALQPLLDACGLVSISDNAGVSEMLEQWSEWLPRLKEIADGLEDHSRHFSAARIGTVADCVWLPPIQRPRKLICMGTNYAGHASEVSSDPLNAPYSFLKSTSNTLRGSGDVVTLLDIAEMNDWEAELAVVIGRPARHVSEADALDYVAGYSIINDVSARDWVAGSPKFLGIDWVVGKSIDGYAPLGPTFTPAEFVEDPQDLDVGLTVNGEVMQQGNTRQMIFGVAQIVAHLSKFMTLEAGDIIASGTPEGTGFGHKPPVFLKDGDVVRASISGLGVLETTFVR